MDANKGPTLLEGETLIPPHDSLIMGILRSNMLLEITRGHPDKDNFRRLLNDGFHAIKQRSGTYRLVPLATS